MIQTFLFKTETPKGTYHHKVYSPDLQSSLQKWLNNIEDFGDQFGSFSREEVQNIKQQYVDGKLELSVEDQIHVLKYSVDDKMQVVYIDEVKKGEPDFIAKCNYLKTEEGGRKGYAASGYRPHVKFDGKKQMTSGEQLFLDKDKVLPGESVTAEIRILSKEIFNGYLFVGQHFEIGEGKKVVGHGEILSIINSALNDACR